MISSFQARHDLIYKEKVSPDTASVAALDQLGGAFQSGRIAMEINGGWGWWTYKPLIDDEANGFCWGAAPLPKGAPEAEQRAVIFTDPWAITGNMSAEDQAASWTFVKFLVSPEQAREYALVGGAPPTQGALLDEYFKQFEKCQDPAEARAIWEGGITNGRESSNHLMVRFDELNQLWDNTLPTLWDDPSATAEAVLNVIQPQLNETLARIKAEGSN